VTSLQVDRPAIAILTNPRFAPTSGPAESMSLSRNYFRLCSLTMRYEKENGKQTLLAVLPVDQELTQTRTLSYFGHCGDR
jgi:hypothetical protein